MSKLSPDQVRELDAKLERGSHGGKQMAKLSSAESVWIRHQLQTQILAAQAIDVGPSLIDRTIEVLQWLGASRSEKADDLLAELLAWREAESRTNSRTPAGDVANALIRIGKRPPD